MIKYDEWIWIYNNTINNNNIHQISVYFDDMRKSLCGNYFNKHVGLCEIEGCTKCAKTKKKIKKIDVNKEMHNEQDNVCLAHCIHYRERAHTAHRTHAHSSSFQPEFVVYFSTPNQLHLFCIPIVDLKCSMCTVHTHVTLKAISSSSYLSVCPGRLWTQRTPAIYSHDKNFDTMHCHRSSIPGPCVWVCVRLCQAYSDNTDMRFLLLFVFCL